jgi:hypothetical protein
MSTAMLERKVTLVGLHARCMEAAVHQPGAWAVRVDGQEVPLIIETLEDETILEVSFIAGPMPVGNHAVSLEFKGNPMHCASMNFDNGQWWKHSLSTKFG